VDAIKSDCAAASVIHPKELERIKREKAVGGGVSTECETHLGTLSRRKTVWNDARQPSRVRADLRWWGPCWQMLESYEGELCDCVDCVGVVHDYDADLGSRKKSRKCGVEWKWCQ
jgi:hypothetical protein